VELKFIGDRSSISPSGQLRAKMTKTRQKLVKIARKLRCFCTFSVFILLNFLRVIELKVVSDSPVSSRLNGSSFHARGHSGSREGSIAEGAVLTWHRADTSLGGPQGSLSGVDNQLTVAGKVIRRQARQCTEGIGVGAQSTLGGGGGGTKFFPEKYVLKISKMPNFT